MNNKILDSIFAKESTPIGTYCYNCAGKSVTIIHSEQGEYFYCDQCGEKYPQAYIFEDSVDHTYENGQLTHQTVGAIINKTLNNTVYTLLFLRRKFPFQYTLPAGHVENNQSIEKNIMREITEETSLTINDSQALWPDEILKLYDPCRRGANYHNWHVFTIQTEGNPRFCDEARIMGWYTQKEVNNFINKNMLTLPTKFILSKYLEEISQR